MNKKFILKSMLLVVVISIFLSSCSSNSKTPVDINSNNYSNGGTIFTAKTTDSEAIAVTEGNICIYELVQELVQELNKKKVFDINLVDFIDEWNNNKLTTYINHVNFSKWYNNGILPMLHDPTSSLKSNSSPDYFYQIYDLLEYSYSRNSIPVGLNIRVDKTATPHKIAAITYWDYEYYDTNPHTVDCFVLAVAIITKDSSDNYANSREIVKKVCEDKEYTQDGIYYSCEYTNKGLTLFMKASK